ncbi:MULTISPECIES: AI-2E family transporter [unclassified Iodidimonas]|jgi:predicted PurR-regulated permease PerM|uniref:AI-2E family transporter n=1 Tax=unclassified Iodidimonas TaxID=2626145 RepID=UPI002483075E|nr:MULTISPECIES: AI-2E family transporter [unclassified Iodidimonas]
MKNARASALPGRLFYARSFALFAVLILGYLVWRIVSPFMAPLAWAAIIAFLLHPAHLWLSRALGARPNLSALILTGLSFLFLLGPISLLLAAFAAQAANLLEPLQQAAAKGDFSILQSVMDVPIIGNLISQIQQMFDVSLDDLGQWLNLRIQEGAKILLSFGSRVFLGAIGTMAAFVIMLFVLFFVLRDGRKILNATKALVPMSDQRTDLLFSRIADAVHAIVFGTVLTALIQGALTGLALAVTGLPAPVVFGVLAAIFSLFPVGGTALIWGPAALVLAFHGQWVEAIGMLLWGMLIVGTIDNFLRPILVSRRSHITTLTVFIGVLGGAVAFGAVGLLLGPVILTIAMVLLRFTRQQREAENEDAPEDDQAIRAEKS